MHAKLLAFMSACPSDDIARLEQPAQIDSVLVVPCRGIEPCKGLWTIPAGFMEIGESSAAGAARETLEEANAAVQIIGPYAHWDIPVIGQVNMLTVWPGACQNKQTDRQKAVFPVYNASTLLAARPSLECLSVMNDAHVHSGPTTPHKPAQ